MKRCIALFLALSVDAIQWLITPFIIFAGIGSFMDAVLDIFMAITLTLLRGFHWAYLPAFVAELIPGVNLVPLWTGAVLLTWNASPPKSPEREAAPKPADTSLPAGQ